jgi:hypothetical protein
MELLRIVPQPSFPEEDLTENNRDLLSHLILDPVYANTAHEMAEQAIVFYKIGHQALTCLAGELQMDMNQHAAFSYGIATYEMIALTARPTVIPDYPPLLINERVGDILSLQSDGFAAGLALRTHEERFTEQAPNTTHVIELASQLCPQFDTRLIRMGAAIQRNIEADFAL